MQDPKGIQRQECLSLKTALYLGDRLNAAPPTLASGNGIAEFAAPRKTRGSLFKNPVECLSETNLSALGSNH